MVARLQIHIKAGAPRLIAGFIEGDDLGVWCTGPKVKPFTHDRVPCHNDSTNCGIGRR